MHIASHHYTATLHDTSPIAALLDMIERKSKSLAIAGGGALSQEQTHYRKLPEAIRNKIVGLVMQGQPLQAVADECGVHYCTVVRLTKHIRTK